MTVRCVLATMAGQVARVWHASGGLALQSGTARLLRDDRGASASQYALIATLICLAIIGGITSLGTSISALYNKPTKVVTNLGT